jgi:hypothetical protein
MQLKNIQVLNEQIPNKQPKKTWVEPELLRLGDVVEGGQSSSVQESHGGTYSPTSNIPF